VGSHSGIVAQRKPALVVLVQEQLPVHKKHSLRRQRRLPSPIPNLRHIDACTGRQAALDLEVLVCLARVQLSKATVTLLQALWTTKLSPRCRANHRPPRSQAVARSTASTPPSYTESNVCVCVCVWRGNSGVVIGGRDDVVVGWGARGGWGRGGREGGNIYMYITVTLRPHCSPGPAPLLPRAAPQSKRREEEEDLEAAHLEDLETAAEEATVAAFQTQEDCFQLHCHAAAPPQPISICTEESWRTDRVFASESWLAFSCTCNVMHERILSFAL
jgi:hypothetical protein